MHCVMWMKVVAMQKLYYIRACMHGEVEDVENQAL